MHHARLRADAISVETPEKVSTEVTQNALGKMLPIYCERLCEKMMGRKVVRFQELPIVMLNL
jgi:hypothetical protein